MTITPDTARTAPAPKGTGSLVAGDGARYARIWGVGGYRPERVVPNSEPVGRIDSSDEWIRERSGIESRRFAAPDESVIDMSTAAAGKAIAQAGIRPEQVSAVLVATVTHPLQTPSGRIELHSARIAAMPNIDLPAHPAWLAPVEWLGAHAAARHPLHLITIQPADRLHSQLDMGPLAQGNKVAGVERVTLNPADAAARGLTPGSKVKIHNDRGACFAGLVLDDGVMPGVAVMATGAWWDPAADRTDRAGTANVLTLDIGTSQLTQGPNAMSCLVEIERA